jgi:serine/threonine protein kinase
VSGSLEFLPVAHEVLEGPRDVGSEQRWRIRLADGRRALVGQLAPDLARDESIRRRWVRDAERIQALQAHCIAPVLEIGPAPDPRAPAAIAPWRMRLDPEGESLETFLARAPVTLEEITAVFGGLADALHAVHGKGAVLRDLRPEQVVLTPDRRVVLTDVGLSRVEVLSSHTASSLLMQGSAYAAPEQVHKTAVDQRSDLYSLGVMMWQALTGELPFGDGPAFLRERTPLAALPTVRRDVPQALDVLVHRLLEDAPERRPDSAADVSWVLRGGAPTSLLEHAMTVCQHCSARLRVGQRLCLQCGRVSVKFVAAEPGEPRYGLDLVDVDESADKLRWLQALIRDISASPVRPPEFLVGSIHMYSDEERVQRIRLPARLYDGLAAETASQLHGLMAEKGLSVRVVGRSDVTRAAVVTGVVTASVAFLAATFAILQLWVAMGITLGAGMIGLLVAASRYTSAKTWVERSLPRYQLRKLPAALPASDPLVARLAALLGEGGANAVAGDVHDVVGELALLVQRLVDHRASFLRDARELEMLTAPIEPLVTHVEALVGELRTIGQELHELDEGAMVRALAASEARKEPPSKRQPILEGLDRLRALEDRRASVFHRLLEAKSLLSRTVEMGLAVHDDHTEHERQVALAVATLGGHAA